VLSSRAIELARARLGDRLPPIDEETGFTPNINVSRIVQADVIAGDAAAQADMIRRAMLDSASSGQTTISVHITSEEATAAVMLLASQGPPPIRFAGKDEFPAEFVAGNDIVWNLGVTTEGGGTDSAYPAHASTASAPPEIKARESEGLGPRSAGRRELYDGIVAGERLGGLHVEGDLTLDQIFDIIETASAEAGLSLDQIRARRHAVDHCAMNPRPDQIPRLASMNMIMSCQPRYIENAPTIVQDYGPQYTKWIVPVRSLLDASIHVVFGTDAPARQRNHLFRHLELLVTRRAPDGVVYNQEERVDRMTALLMATRWGADYVLKSDVLGSIEVGKWADLVVLDRDYSTVPEGEISEVQPVMTLVGGRTVFSVD
jgi:predicted amidohydrolase YtcJ